MRSLSGARALVVGLGSSGSAAARALLDIGADVRVTESAATPGVRHEAEALRRLGAEVEIGGHDLSRLDADVAVVSPGIPPWAPVVRALVERGTELLGEVELAWQLSQCDFIAVTGTNGKTTTTSLIAGMLSEAGVPSAAGGNIGVPLVEAVRTVPAGGVIAVELSSFQLAAIDRFRARVAVMLNVAEDHTDWHGTFDSYVRAKARIVENQTAGDVFVANAEDEHVMKVASDAVSRVVPFSATRPLRDGAGTDGSTLLWRGEELLPVDAVPVPGAAGLEDTLAAAAAALEFGVDRRAVVRAIKGFRPLAHRMQTVAELEGVSYIDDSKATNPHATLTALSGMSDVVLIAGGRSKGIDLSALVDAAPSVRAVIALGEAAPELTKLFEGVTSVETVASMDEAVRRARTHAIHGGSVLLSPACASLDMYTDYAQRGEDFARAVREMVNESPRGGGRRG